GWRVSTICRRCQRQNLHSKHMNWLAAQKAWKAIGLNVSAAWMQQHSKKLSDWYWDLEQDPHWKIKKPQFAAGASGKGATTDGDDTRPVTFALSPDEPDLQTNPNQTQDAPRRGAHMPNIHDSFPSRYMKCEDLKGKKLKVIIESVNFEVIRKNED